MMNDRILLSPPHMSGRESHYIKEAFDTNWIAPLGPNVDEFENEVVDYTGTGDALAVSSGTAAIHLALALLDVKKGDVVFCSSLTFVASANPILYQGAEPVFIDSEPDTWNMSPQALRKALEEAEEEGQLPKAVIVVHLYGQSAKMDELLFICDFYGVPIIEDAAESLGSTYKGKMSGTLGKFGIFSFNGNKIITTSGGGMLVSDNIGTIQTARFLATQAKDPAAHYEHSVMGYNYRMSNILAGIGRTQMQVLCNRVELKRHVFKKYFTALADLPGVKFMPELENTRSNRWLTTLTIDERVTGVSAKEIIAKLDKENIEARHVWKPMHTQPLFKGTRFYSHKKEGSIADDLFEQGICLPSGTGLSSEDQNRIINTIKDILNRSKKHVIMLKKWQVRQI